MKRKDRKKVRMPKFDAVMLDAVMVDAAGTPGEYGERSKDGKCPRCGAKPSGFSTMYVGRSTRRSTRYEFCTAECGWHWKIVRRNDEE